MIAYHTEHDVTKIVCRVKVELSRSGNNVQLPSACFKPPWKIFLACYDEIMQVTWKKLVSYSVGISIPGGNASENSKANRFVFIQ